MLLISKEKHKFLAHTSKNKIAESSPKKFALIGAAGFIAPKHMRAIKESGNNIIAALDPCDSVGIMDTYFPKADFFTEPERFDRYLDKKKRIKQTKIDFVSICSPNYLHDAHIRMALRNDADAICEKPVVLNPWNIDALLQIEKESNKKIYNILQLRLHPSIVSLKKQIENGPNDKIYDVDLTYITSRGKWYFQSWKGNLEKSGGIASNIGVHFFDMLFYVFGKCKKSQVHLKELQTNAGYMEFEKARVRWFLSVDENYLSNECITKNERTYRSIKVDDKEIEFSNGFTDLHTIIYQDIMKGKGFKLEEARPSIEVVYDIRNAEVRRLKGDYHPILKK